MLEGLDDIPWSSLTHAYGEASDVPGQIRALASEDPEARKDALSDLYGNIHHQGTVYEATGHAVPYLVEIAGHPTAGDRAEILGLLAALAEGSSYLDVHRHLTHPGEDSRTPEFQGQLRRELEGVRAAREAVLAGVPTIIRLLEDPETDVRIAASYLLGRLPERADEEIDPLKWRVELEEDARARASAILAVGMLLGTSASGMDRDRIAEVAHADGPPIETLAAAMSVARMAPDEVPREILERLAFAVGLAAKDYEALPWCEYDAVDDVGAVFRAGSGARFDFQIGLLSHEEPEVREAAISSIEGVCRARRSAPEVAVSPLAGRLRDGNPAIREAAAAALSHLGRAVRGIVPSLFTALDDSSWKVRTLVAVALGKMGDQRAVPALIEGLGSHLEFEKVAEALSALGPKAGASVPALMGIVAAGPTDSGHSRWNRPIRAAITLGKIGGPATVAIPTLIGAVRRGQIVNAACLAFADFGPAAVDALPAIERVLDTPDANLRTIAARAIWKVGGDAERAVDVLSSAIREQPASCSNAIETLAEIGEPARIALPLLEGPLGDRSSFHSAWNRIRTARAFWRIDRRADVALPVLLEYLESVESLGTMRAKLVVEGLGEIGSGAKETIPQLRRLSGVDERPFGGAVDMIIEEDEAFLDTVEGALARIGGG